MKSISNLLAELKVAGFTLSYNGEKLNLKSKIFPIPKQVIADVKGRKNEIIEFFKNQKIKEKPIEKAIVGVPVEATSTQKRLWMLEQGQVKGKYNIAMGFRMEGHLNVKAFRESLADVLESYDIFYTSFYEMGGSLYQKLEENIKPIKLQIGNLNNVDIQAKLEEYAKIQFEITKGELYQQELFQAGTNEYFYLFACHHIIMDGRSLEFFFNNITECYNLKVVGKEKQLDDKKNIGFFDHAYWLQHGGAKKQITADIEYWKNQLIGADYSLIFPPAYLSLPEKDGALRFSLPNDLCHKLEGFSRKHQITPFSIFYATYKLLLIKMTGQYDFLIGHPIDNRPHKSLQDIIGYFANTIALRVCAEDKDTFIELVAKVHKSNIDSLRHTAAPFEQIVAELNPIRTFEETPLFQCFFTYQNSSSTLGLNEVKTTKLQRLSESAKFPLSLIVEQDEQKISIVWEYSCNYFNASQIKLFHQRFLLLLNNGLSEPECSIGKMDYWTPEDKSLFERFNNKPSLSICETAVDKIDKIFSSCENKPAIVQPDGVIWSYRKLNNYVRQIENIFIDNDLKAGDTVIFSLRRSAEMVAIQIAALRLNIIFIPFSPEQPEFRLASIVNDAKATFCFCEKEQLSYELSVPKTCVPIVLEDQELLELNISLNIQLDDVAYVGYTSGSTGSPKGVIISHRAMANMIIALTEEDIVLPFENTMMVAGESFDASIMEIWLALTAGAVIHIPSPEIKSDLKLICKYIQDNSITSTWLPTSYMELILSDDYLCRYFDRARLISTGGGKLSLPATTNFIPLLVDMYGPSENTVVTSIKRYTSEDLFNCPDESIGKPIANINIDILSPGGFSCAPGIVGEIAIKGISLASGYINTSEIDDQKFDCDNNQTRSYLSGDIGFINEMGELVYLRRKGNQIQLRGFRVELAEIEFHLNMQNEIDISCVIYDQKREQLSAFVIPELSHTKIVKILSLLESKLPHYMIPRCIESLKFFPLTANDKIDKDKLLSMSGKNKIEQDLNQLSSEQSSVAQLFSEALKVPLDKISLDSNFFELGGHSLLAMKLLAKFRDNFNVDIAFTDILRKPTIKLLTELISKSSLNENRLSRISKSQKNIGLPISASQETLWSLYKLGSNFEVYNIQSVYRIEGELKVKKFISALKKVYFSHDALHSRFIELNEQVLMHTAVDSNWQVEEHKIKESELPDWIELEKNRKFDLQHGEVFIAHLLQYEDQSWFLQLNLPHLVTDGWSMNKLWLYIIKDYQSEFNVEPEPVIGFIDYLALGNYQNNDKKYWLNQLMGYEPIQFHSISEPQLTDQFIWRTSLLSEQSKQLQELSQRAQVPESVVSMCVFSLLISRYLGINDVVVSTPYVNRGSGQLESVLGYLVSMLPIRIKSTENLTVHSLFHFIDHSLKEGMDASEFDIHELLSALNLQNLNQKNPLQQIVFSWQAGITDLPFIDGVDVSKVHVDHFAAKFPLMLSMYPEDDLYQMSWEFDPGLLSIESIHELQKQFSTLISELHHKGDRSLSQIVFPSHKIIKKFENSRQILMMFEKVVKRYCNKTALSFGEQTWTYQDLDKYSDNISACLQYHGVKPGDFVGLTSVRSPEQVFFILGILKAGAAYLPLDKVLPKSLFEEIRERTAFSICLVSEDSDLGDVLAINFSDAMNWTESKHLKVVVQPDSAAYINFSSGSTGKPKGIVCTHQGVVRLVCDQTYMKLNDKTVMLSAAPATFDAFTLEVWGPLLNGGQIALAPEQGLNTEHFKRLISKNEVNTAWLSSALFSMFAEIDVSIFAGLQQLLVGGDIVSPKHVHKVYHACPDLKIINGYGPTENTTFTSCFQIPNNWPSNKSIPIGKAINGTQIYILNDNELLQPRGFVGEITVSGLGLAQGYLGSSELDSTKFTSLHMNDTQVRVYKTGDLGFFDFDNNLHFIGRKDDEVKVNGFRIRLEAVDSVLSQHENVLMTKTLAVKDDSKQLLVSFIKAENGAISLEELPNFISTKLPVYMQPSVFIPINKIPMLANGKLDRQSLINRFNARTSTLLQERALNENEKIIATIWQTLLNCNVTSPNSNFYNLGGNSLLALKSQHMLGKALNREIPLKSIMQHFVLSELAKAIPSAVSSQKSTAISQEGALSDSSNQLSIEQMRLWIHHQIEPGSAYNIPLFIEIPLEIDLLALEQAVYKVLQEYPILRMQFIELNGDIYQEPFSLVNWSLTVENLPMDGLDKRIEQESKRIFELDNGLPCFISLLAVGTNRRILLFNIHHICFDGGSLALFVKALNKALEKKELASIKQFGNFVSWQKGKEFQQLSKVSLDYWSERLAGYTECTKLPPDLSYSTDNISKYISYPINSNLVLQARKLTKACGVSDFSFWLSIFNITLARVNQKYDLVIATPISNRLKHEFEDIIGYFANTLLFRHSINESDTFSSMLNDLNGHMMEAVCHQVAPLDQLVKSLASERADASIPITQVMFSVSYPEAMELAGKPAKLFFGFNNQTKYDFSMTVSIQKGNVNLEVEYNSCRYSKGLIDSFLDSIKLVLEQICCGSDPKIDSLILTKSPIIPVQDINGNLPLISELIKARATNHPSNCALKTEGKTLSYGELYSRAQKVAGILQSLGISPQDRVAILMYRDINLPVTLLATFLVGAIYIPFDPGYPIERIKYLLEDVEPHVILVNSPELFNKIHKDLPVYNVDDLLAESRQHKYINVSLKRHDLAYIIYTSGSTGRPKGVKIRHESLSYLYQWADETYNSEDFSLVFSGTSICFDLSIFELFITWAIGGTVFFAENTLSLIDDALAYPISLINTVPSVLSEVIKYVELPKSVKVVNLAGEPLPSNLADNLFDHNTNIRLFNLYGPSEDTTYSTAYAIDKFSTQKILIGKAINGTYTSVMDSQGRSLPDYFSGELYLAGKGLSQGYWKRPDLELESFTENSSLSVRAYKTGDNVRVIGDGQIEYIGRSDFQIKLRGFRIELNEIDCCLIKFKGINRACTVLNENIIDSTEVVSFVIQDSSDYNESILQEKLADTLPHYMVPSKIIFLDKFPVTSSGKQDRRELIKLC